MANLQSIASDDGEARRCDATEFIRQITACSPQHYIELRLKNPRSIVRGHYHPEESELGRDIEEGNRRSLDVYYGVAPRTTAGKGDRAHVAGLGAFFVDSDRKRISKQDADALLETFLPPSGRVSTGGGDHDYWLLKEFYRFQADDDFDFARSLLRKAAVRLAGDIAAAEPVRILRVPDTRNLKYSPPRPVRLEYWNPARRYSLAEFAAALRDVEEPARVVVNTLSRVPTPLAEGHTSTSVSSDDLKLILNRARGAANGEKFRALYDRGDLSGYNNDHSTADFALVKMLSFYAGGSASTIDALFRASALMRPKWDAPRPSGTYGSLTVAQAIASTSHFYTGKPA